MNFSRALAFTLLVSCGGTSVDPDAGDPNGSGGSGAGGSAGSGGSASGGSSGSSAQAPWVGTDAGKVDIGDCVFDDPDIEIEVRYKILQADNMDGVLDGSAGPEAVIELDVVGETLTLGGLECLTNLEELWLSVYGEDAPSVSLTPIAGLSSLRMLSLSGPFELAGALGGLSLESLHLTHVGLANLEEVALETGIRELWLSDVPLTSLSGIEQLTALDLLRIERANLTDLSPLAATSNLTELHLREIPNLKSLEGVETHLGLQDVLTSKVPVESLVPLAGASALESLNVWTSALVSLDGLEGKPDLVAVTVRDAAVSDLSALSGSPALTYLTLTNNSIGDLSPLSTCTALTYLEVSGNVIETLAPVASLAALESLQAADNALTAIDVELPASLASLSIANNQVTSLAPLAGHPLEFLDISSNPVESLAPLFDMPELLSLIASDIGATDLEAFPLATLSGLTVQNNNIESVAALQGLQQISVDLTGNDVVSLPADFVGPSENCSKLVLVDNPLDDAAKARLELLCEQGSVSYSWDGGSCDACPRI